MATTKKEQIVNPNQGFLDSLEVLSAKIEKAPANYIERYEIVYPANAKQSSPYHARLGQTELAKHGVVKYLERPAVRKLGTESMKYTFEYGKAAVESFTEKNAAKSKAEIKAAGFEIGSVVLVFVIWKALSGLMMVKLGKLNLFKTASEYFRAVLDASRLDKSGATMSMINIVDHTPNLQKSKKGLLYLSAQKFDQFSPEVVSPEIFDMMMKEFHRNKKNVDEFKSLLN